MDKRYHIFAGPGRLHRGWLDYIGSQEDGDEAIRVARVQITTGALDWYEIVYAEPARAGELVLYDADRRR